MTSPEQNQKNIENNEKTESNLEKQEQKEFSADEFLENINTEKQNFKKETEDEMNKLNSVGIDEDTFNKTKEETHIEQELVIINKEAENIIRQSKNEVLVEQLFEINPEIALIGSKEQYLTYIENIFPDSKVKDILWHGTNENFESFDMSKKTRGEGQYFTDSYKTAHEYAYIQWETNGNERVVGVLLNMQKIKHADEKKDFEAHKIDEAYDSIIMTNNRKGEDGDYYIVYQPEQIHVLGSNKDLEDFRDWAKK